MAGAAHCLSPCFALPFRLKNLSLNTSVSESSSRFLSFSTSLSNNVVSRGSLSLCTMEAPARLSIYCGDAPKKKASSAEKRVRQAEKRRIYNKSRKSEIKTRMKKVLAELEVLQKKPDAQPEEILPVEKLIGKAYSVIDKAVKVGTLHRNTGARRKSRLARRKKALEIQRGWYVPAPVPALTA